MSQLLHVSDIHATSEGTLYERVRPLERLRAAAHFAGELQRQEGSELVGVIITGDLVQRGNPGAYPLVREALAELAEVAGVPVLTLPGNHDEARAARDAGFAEWPREEVLSAGAETVRVLLLDSSAGELGDTQLAWLREQLQRPSTAAHTIVALHHPPLLSPLPPLRGAELRDSRELLGAVDEAAAAGTPVTAVLTGHFHHAHSAWRAGTLIHVAPALAYQQHMTPPPGTVQGHDAAAVSLLTLGPAGAGVSSITHVQLPTSELLFTQRVRGS